MAGGVGSTRLAKANSSASAELELINPATEEKQDDIISAINSIGGNAGSLGDGRKVVAVTNTAIAIGSAACKTVFITALIGNSAEIVIGGSGVIFPEATRTGTLKYPGDGMTVSVDNLSDVYINGNAGDGISFSYTKV